MEDDTNIPTCEEVFVHNAETNRLEEFDIREEMVLKKLSELNINKSQGPDEIHPKFLYELRGELAKPLTVLYNFSMKFGAVPQDWKDANVTPII